MNTWVNSRGIVFPDPGEEWISDNDLSDLLKECGVKKSRIQDFRECLSHHDDTSERMCRSANEFFRHKRWPYKAVKARNSEAEDCIEWIITHCVR
jgi:hypothetical protein